MRVRNVARSKSEVRTDSVLRTTLEKRGYRVERNVRVSDVIELDRQDLSGEEMHCYRTMHFDFTVTQGDYGTPRFVVEFDGPHHTLDSSAAHLDAVKNDLCRRAELPILRVSSRELEQNERVSLLAWMLERWVAWQQEGRGLRGQVNAERARLLGSGMHPDEVADSGPASAEFYFDLSHPYPAVLTVEARLQRLGIVTTRADAKARARIVSTRRVERMAECMALPGGFGPAGAGSHYSDYVAQVRQWRPGQPYTETADGALLYTARQRVVWRWALPIGWDAPSVIASEPKHGDLQERTEWWVTAMGHLWNSDLPGAPSHQIAEGLAEYLVLRDVEQWASQHRAAQS